jgi:hypothetical protein
LIYNWDGIKSRLEKLKTELNEMRHGIGLEVNMLSSAKTALQDDASGPKPPEIPQESEGGKATQALTQEDGHVEVAGKGIEATETPPESKANFQSSDEIKPTAEYEMLETRVSQLQCLHDFISTDLRNLIDLLAKIQEGSLEKIAFDGIYHLYSPGDLIINREEDSDLLYQVYAVTGGRVRLQKYENTYRSITGEEAADDSPSAGIETWTDVVINCFRMHWDGTQVGMYFYESFLTLMDQFGGEKIFEQRVLA